MIDRLAGRTWDPSAWIDRRLVSSAFWSAASEALSRGLLLIAMVAVAGMLGREGFGQLGIIRSTITMFASVGGMGLGLTANRFLAQARDADPRYSGQLIGSTYLVAAVAGTVVGATVFLGAGIIARVALGAAELQSSLRIAGVLLLLGAVNGAQIGVLQGFEAYRRLALGSLAQGVTALVAVLVGAHWWGLAGALAGFVAFNITSIATMHALIVAEARRRGIRIVYGRPTDLLPLFFRFSLPVTLMSVAVAPLKWACEAILAKESGFSSLGLFTASTTIASMLTAMVSTLNAPLISLAANEGVSQKPKPRDRLTLYASWYAFLLVAMPLVAFPALTGSIFAKEFAGTEFYVVNLLLVPYCGLLLYYQGIMRLVALTGSMWFGFFTNLAEGASLIAVFYPLRHLGPLGLGLAYVASYLVRVAVSVPVLLSNGVVSRQLLLDRHFLATLALLGTTVALQIWRLR